MKRFILLLSVVVCLLFSACTVEKDVGIIGGADGPTKVYVGGAEYDTSEKKPVRMIRVDGTLYYDTQKVSDMTPRCGTLDGNLKKTADEYEVPQKDGQSNFKAEGYQNTTGLTKEIPLEGSWVIFKKIDDHGKDLLKYKYCYYLRGTMPNAAVESELIVLANDKKLDFERVTRSFFSSNTNDFLDIYTIWILPEDKWGVTLTADYTAGQGLTVRCEQFGGAPTGELQTGPAYTLERNNDGTWEAVETRTGEPLVWNMLAFMIAKNDITTWDIDLENDYGNLPAGRYRVGKKIDDFRETGDYDSKVYYAEFTVE